MISRVCNGRRKRNSGFTLVEILLVLAIVAMLAAISVPTFIRSLRGNRLSAAARTVVMAGRYARSMAVLRQEQMTVTFDTGKRRVTVDSAGAGSAAGPGTAGGGERHVDAGRPAAGETGAADPGVAAAGASRTDRGPDRMVRELDRVDIDRVDIAGLEDPPAAGEWKIVYDTNGRCVPYTVRLKDGYDDTVTIKVDAVAGVEIAEND